MSTVDDLIQNVYATFSAAYAAETSRGEAAIAFEPLGISPGIDPSQPAAVTSALEFMSRTADCLPDLSGGIFSATLRSISGAYGLMLSASVPSDGTNVITFNLLKSQALEAFSNDTVGSTAGPSSYYPAFAVPMAWYDPAAAQVAWSTYNFTADQPSTTSTSTSTAGGASNTGTQSGAAASAGDAHLRQFKPLFLSNPWRLMSTKAAPQSPSAALASVQMTAVHTEFGTTPARPAAGPFVQNHVWRGPYRPTHPVGTGQSTTSSGNNTSNGDSADSLHPQFSMSFDYCLIRLQRPWLSGDFLESPGWFVPGTSSGSMSNPADPSPSAPTALAANDSGASRPFDWLPVACIAVKNLSIESGGGFDKGVAATATAFGPFVLTPQGAGQTSLSNPGLQIIAWICAPQPLLPPDTDPACAVPAPAAPASSTPASSPAAAPSPSEAGAQQDSGAVVATSLAVPPNPGLGGASE